MSGRTAVALYAFLSIAPLAYRVATDFHAVGVAAIAFSIALVLWLRSRSRTAWGVLLVLDGLGVVGGFMHDEIPIAFESLLLLAVLLSPPMREYVGVGEPRPRSAPNLVAAVVLIFVGVIGTVASIGVLFVDAERALVTILIPSVFVSVRGVRELNRWTDQD